LNFLGGATEVAWIEILKSFCKQDYKRDEGLFFQGDLMLNQKYLQLNTHGDGVSMSPHFLVVAPKGIRFPL
jgi:hypothetical protein